jgi:hypothetical protein
VIQATEETEIRRFKDIIRKVSETPSQPISQAQWFASVIQATEGRNRQEYLWLRLARGKKHEILSKKYLNRKKTGGLVQVIEYLPSKHNGCPILPPKVF